MKTLTTLTAVAALIAGVSIASAQSGVPKSQTKSPEALQKNSSQSSKTENNQMKTGASKMGSNKKVTGNSRFCIQEGRGGSLNCTYTTMASCEKAAKPKGTICSENPSMGTTGAK